MSTIMLTDGYKVGHIHHMPEEITYQLNNWTPRGTRREGVDKIVVFGLQYFVKKYLIKKFNKTFFNQPKQKAVNSWYRIIKAYLGKHVSVKHIEDLHDLGYLPIKIKALPEGSRVNLKVPPVTIESTHGKKYVWLVGYLETLFSCVNWPMSTSATTAFEFYKVFHDYAMKTVGNADFVQFQGHDFSFRGMFGVEAAKMSGAAHLTSFVGTDTIPAISFLEKYYNADCEKELVACSVEATEHSVMCLGTGLFIYRDYNGDWERLGDAEFDVFKRLITEVCPTGFLSIVSDTFNLWTVLNDFLPRLREEIVARDGKVIIRPDSGDPVKIMTGYKIYDADAEGLQGCFATDNQGNLKYEAIKYDGKYYHNIPVTILQSMPPKYLLSGDAKEMTETEAIGVIRSLWNTFGGSITEKGYKLLDPHIGSIYGDSITKERAVAICQRLMDFGYASINWVAGMGSYTYQYVTRDTDMWAMKATFGKAELISQEDYQSQGGPSLGEKFEVGIPVYKDPITDDGTKKSARGRIKVECHIKGDVMANKVSSIDYVLIDQVTEEEQASTYLQDVFEDGTLLRDESLAQIRQRLRDAVRRND